MIYKTKQERAEESRRAFSNAEFKEEDHPRGADGKFGKGGGGKKETKPAFETGTEKIKNPTARKMAESAFSIVSKYIDTLPEIETRNGMRDYARYSPSNDKIFVSTKVNSSAVENLKRGVKDGFYTQDNPILHELGHYLAFKLDPSGFDNLKNLNWNDSEKEMLRKNISEYAVTNGKELIAEYASGVMSGRKYPKEVNDFINKTVGWKGKGGFFGLIDQPKENSSPIRIYRASK